MHTSRNLITSQRSASIRRMRTEGMPVFSSRIWKLHDQAPLSTSFTLGRRLRSRERSKLLRSFSVCTIATYPFVPIFNLGAETCKRCGYMSSNDLCKACSLLEGLERGMPRAAVVGFASPISHDHLRLPQTDRAFHKKILEEGEPPEGLRTIPYFHRPGADAFAPTAVTS